VLRPRGDRTQPPACKWCCRLMRSPTRHEKRTAGPGRSLCREAVARIGPDPTTAFAAKQSYDAGIGDHSYVTEALVPATVAGTNTTVAHRSHTRGSGSRRMLPPSERNRDGWRLQLERPLPRVAFPSQAADLLPGRDAAARPYAGLRVRFTVLVMLVGNLLAKLSAKRRSKQHQPSLSDC